MPPELYFVYDSHCPWSYAAAALVNQLKKAYPEMSVRTYHCAHYNGSDCAGHQQVMDVTKQSRVKFGQQHLRFADSPKNAIISANLMAWLQDKQPDKALEVLNALQKAHFIDGNALTCKYDFAAIIEQFKLSPANKIFKDSLTEQAESALSDIYELQQFIGTTAFPALLLVVGDDAVLLNHALYLGNPESLVKDVMQRLKK